MRVKHNVFRERQIALLRNLSTKRSKYTNPGYLDSHFEFKFLCNVFPRRLIVLEDQFRNAQDELKERKESLKKNRPTPSAMKADQSEIKRLENQLDKYLNSYADL